MCALCMYQIKLRCRLPTLGVISPLEWKCVPTVYLSWYNYQPGMRHVVRSANDLAEHLAKQGVPWKYLWFRDIAA